MSYSIGQIVMLNTGVAPSLREVRVQIININAIGILTVMLLENGKGSSCWKAGDKMYLNQHSVKEIDHESVHP